MTVIFAPVHFTPNAGQRGFGRLESGSVPLTGDVSSPFNAWEQWRRDAGLGPHRGLDIAAAEGTAILCPAPGTIRAQGVWDGLPAGQTKTRLGNYVSIDHGGGVITIYAHLLEPPAFVIGSGIAAGARVGKVGQTGEAYGPHLHWVCVRNGIIIDPLTLTQEREPVRFTKRILLGHKILLNEWPSYLEADGAYRTEPR